MNYDANCKYKMTIFINDSVSYFLEIKELLKSITQQYVTLFIKWDKDHTHYVGTFQTKPN